MKNMLILNGPNLNLLGKREKDIYGNVSFEEYFKSLVEKFNNVELTYFQSNHEGLILDRIHEVGFSWDGIVLNAGAYTHTSIAIADAIKAISTPVVEVHISNIFERETFRHKSYLTDVCVNHFIGHGLQGYDMAIEYLTNL